MHLQANWSITRADGRIASFGYVAAELAFVSFCKKTKKKLA